METEKQLRMLERYETGIYRVAGVRIMVGGEGGGEDFCVGGGYGGVGGGDVGGGYLRGCR